jgi:hypothetical protein
MTIWMNFPNSQNPTYSVTDNQDLKPPQPQIKYIFGQLRGAKQKFLGAFWMLTSIMRRCWHNFFVGRQLMPMRGGQNRKQIPTDERVFLPQITRVYANRRI